MQGTLPKETLLDDCIGRRLTTAQRLDDVASSSSSPIREQKAKRHSYLEKNILPNVHCSNT
jgi:hypothetical protein